jgi:hypothetical protein
LSRGETRLVRTAVLSTTPFLGCPIEREIHLVEAVRLDEPWARARGRMMESLSVSGDEAGAVSAARDYLKEYPGGSHGRLAQRLSAANREP